MTPRVRILSAELVICSCLAGLAGCQKTLWVRQYPEFYSPDLKTIGVAPFHGRAFQAGAGSMFARHLAAGLRENGTYEVVGPAELRSIIDKDKKGTEPVAGKVTEPVSDEVIARRLREHGGIQAFFIGEVTAYAYSESYDAGSLYNPYYYGLGYYYYRPYRSYDYYNYPYGGGYYGTDYWDYYGPRYEFVDKGNVAVEVSMVRVSDGVVVHSAPIQMAVRIRRYSARQPRNALMEAVDRAVRHLVSEFAIIPVEIKVDPDKDFRTARERKDGQWQFAEKFRSNEETMYVVLCLPRPADRNTFRLTVTPKGKKTNVLFSKDFTWSRKDISRGFAFSPKEIAAGMGPGRYSAHFYAGGKSVMTCHFQIEAP